MKNQMIMTKDEFVKGFIAKIKEANPAMAEKSDSDFNIKVKSKTGKIMDFSGLVIEIELGEAAS